MQVYFTRFYCRFQRTPPLPLIGLRAIVEVQPPAFIFITWQPWKMPEEPFFSSGTKNQLA